MQTCTQYTKKQKIKFDFFFPLAKLAQLASQTSHITENLLCFNKKKKEKN